MVLNPLGAPIGWTEACNPGLRSTLPLLISKTVCVSPLTDLVSQRWQKMPHHLAQEVAFFRAYSRHLPQHDWSGCQRLSCCMVGALATRATDSHHSQPSRQLPKNHLNRRFETHLHLPRIVSCVIFVGLLPGGRCDDTAEARYVHYPDRMLTRGCVWRRPERGGSVP